MLGAAAFLIAEFLKISYMDVILMATIPTLLYYLALFLMVELDARKLGVRDEVVPPHGARRCSGAQRASTSPRSSRWSCSWCLGFSPIIAVFWATALAGRPLVPPEGHRLTPAPGGRLHHSSSCRRCGAARWAPRGSRPPAPRPGSSSAWWTLTGLGLKFSSIVIDLAGGNLMLTAVFTALVVWIVGLAVPVTASYIICAVIAAPALIKLGVPDFAAHMFIFYYAVLSEVSPPTASSPFAAAAITGGNPYRTTLQSWKYTLPAFLVPFAFVLDPAARACSSRAASLDTCASSVTAFIGIAALACGVQGWMFRRTSCRAAHAHRAPGSSSSNPAERGPTRRRRRSSPRRW